MEVIPRLYAHSKYTRYLPAVVYGSYTMAVVTPQFAQLAGVTAKPGLWTLDWTVDWTMDWTGDDHYQLSETER